MTNADSAHPSGHVPDAPVVDISIVGDVVSVDGVVIAHDGTRPLHHVAVHAAAERAARPLGRPVRAVATDSEGRATMLVHPDGRATDVELVESFAALDEAPVAAPPVEAAPTVAMPLPPAPPPVPPVPTVFAPVAGVAGSSAEEPLPAPAALRTSTSAPAHSSTVAGGSASWPSKVVRIVAVAAALVAVVGMGVLLLTRSGDDTDRATDPITEVEPTPVAASAPVAEPTPTPAPSPALPVEATGPTLTVTPVAGTGTLQLTLDLEDATPGQPLTAEVSVLAAGAGAPLRRTLTLEDSTTEVFLGKGRLPGGPATWKVEVAGLPAQEGAVTIGAFSPPAPTPTPTPVAPVAPPVAPVAPVAPPVTVTATPSPAPQADPKPQPKPPATRQPQPKQPEKKRPSKSRLKQ